MASDKKDFRIRKLDLAAIREMIKLYQKGSTARALADRYGVHKNTVTYHLHKYGVPVRSLKDYFSPRKVK